MLKKIILFSLCFNLSAAGWAKLPEPEFELKDMGSEEVIDYEKYGQFEGAGSADYRYVIKDREGLAKACGTGIFPNNQSVFSEPAYQEYRKKKMLEGSHWKFSKRNRELNFYKWSVAAEDPATKEFNVALNLERAGLLVHAVKAYYSLIVHFPRSVGYTYWKTPWYPAMSAADKIQNILRKYPELDIDWIDGKVEVVNAYDNETKNDITICNPGKLISKHRKAIKPLYNKTVKKTVGNGRVQLVQYENRHWQLLVDGKPFQVRAVTYDPTPVGQSPEYNTRTDWMRDDINNNDIIDAPYESWVDKNLDNVQGADEPVVGDAQLLKDMGANTIRIYHHKDHPNAKAFLRDLYKKYGIMAMMGNLLGMYARDSGATWQEGTDYRNFEHRRIMFEGIKRMVLEHKDEPYVLMWVLGNENVFGVACNANKYPEEYFKFINEVAEWIHTTDPNHPVAVANGDLLFIDSFIKYAPNIDIFGANVYRGEHGFGESFWRAVYTSCDKPVIITEYGCPAYFGDEPAEYGEEWQARYLEGNWDDIKYNSYGYGYGNALGGVLFEWMDEWWKTMGFSDPKKHKTDKPWGGPFPDGGMYEEWLGVASQGDGKNSPFIRQLRKAYYLYRDKLWKSEN